MLDWIMIDPVGRDRRSAESLRRLRYVYFLFSDRDREKSRDEFSKMYKESPQASFVVAKSFSETFGVPLTGARVKRVRVPFFHADESTLVVDEAPQGIYCDENLGR